MAGRFTSFSSTLSPRFKLYGAVAAAVFLLVLCVRSFSIRDPGSWFFDPDVAYTPKYSAIRQRQAERYIEVASTAPPFQSRQSTAPLCVGVPSIARHGARYLRTTVGSLLAGLTQEERDGIHLIAFIAHTDPTVHPAYHEAWLPKLADNVLSYNLSREEMDHVVAMENEKGLHREKGLFDYNYLLKECRAMGASYIAMIEDDNVAMDGWYRHTIAGIREAEEKSAEKASNGFLYLRMFYTEQFLGWNSEFWPTYLFWSLVTVGTSFALLRVTKSRSSDANRVLTPWLSASICLGAVPLGIILFFAAGKVTVRPLPAGVNEMNNFGCCAQGLIFPRHKAGSLIQWFDTKRVGFADMLTEEYANEHHEQRWALTPSVLQHVGMKSSKQDEKGRVDESSNSVAESIWNFGFELLSVEDLRREHELAAIDPVTLG